METVEEMYNREEADLREELVTHFMEVEGHLIVVENVPARVNQVTGERLFSLATVDQLMQIAQGSQPALPQRVVEAQVFSFAA